MICMPVCINSSKYCNKICTYSQCDRSPFICKMCPDSACLRDHKNHHESFVLRWTEVSSLIECIGQDVKLSQDQALLQTRKQMELLIDRIKGSFEAHMEQVKMINNKLELRSSLKVILNKLQQKDYGSLSCMQMKELYQRLKQKQQYQNKLQILRQLDRQNQVINCLYQSFNNNLNKYQSCKQILSATTDKIVQEASINLLLNSFKQQYYIERAYRFYELFDEQRAERDFNEAVDQYGTSQAYFHRGLFYHKKNQTDKALDDYNKSIQLDQGNANAYNNRGCIFMNRKDYTQAQLNYTKSLQLESNIYEYYCNRAQLFTKINKLDLAKKDFERCAQLNHNLSEDVYLERGIFYYKSEMFKECISDLDLYIDSNQKNNEESYLYRGMAKQKLGLFSEALIDYNTAIEHNSKFGDAFTRRAILHKLLNNFHEAKQDLDMAILLNGQDEKLKQLKKQINKQLKSMLFIVDSDQQSQ